jgi:uncharacterized protein
MVELHVTQLTSFVSKSVGLLNAGKAHPILFRTRFGIHTFGMKYPIDVLILDKQNRIVKLVEKLLPNKIFVWSPRFDIVIELPAGEIKKHGLRKGDDVRISRKRNYEVES